MIVSDTAVNKSTTVLVLAVVILVFGVYSYVVLPRESEPDITIPYVFVSTSYRGVSPTDMETAITIEIEKKLKGLDGVKKIKSVSSEGESSITIEFVTGIDIDKAVQDVKDKVDEAKNELPADLEDDPMVFEVNLSEMPIVVFSLSGDAGPARLKEIADDLQDEIEAIPGVLEALVTGGLEREVRVEVDPEKLAYYNISIPTFQRILASENQNTSGGAIRLGDGRFQLRVPGEFRSPDEIQNLVLTTHDGQPVYLKDLARVVDGYKEEQSRSRLNGRPAVNIAVKKRSGENIIRITDAIDVIIERQKPLWPSGTSVVKVMDKAHDIRNMVADLENNILSGLVLVIVVLFFFLGFRNALLVSLAIPFSMLLSFVVLNILGITLNMVVLYSLTLALGMLADNAIVIIENIYRFIQQGVPRLDAARQATGEVAWPVIGSTLTTLAAFSPMLFWPGIMGEFMGYLPLTLIVTLSSSLFVALVINPALAAIFMHNGKGTNHGRSRPGLTHLPSGRQSAVGEKPVEITGKLLSVYAGLLRFSLKHPVVVVGYAFTLLVLLFQVWLLVIGIEKPVEFFPDIQPKSMYVNVDVPEGADIDYIDTIMKRIEMAVAGTSDPDIIAGREAIGTHYLPALAPKQHPLARGGFFDGPSDIGVIENIYSKTVIAAGGGSRFEANAPNHVGVQFVDFDQRLESSKKAVEEIRRRVEKIPGGIITVAMQEEGPPTGAPVNIEIAGDDFAVLGELARQVRAVLEKVPHVEDIRDDFVQGTPSVRVKVDRQKAALFGITTDMIGFALKTAYNGLDVSSFREGDEDYDITVQLPERDRRTTDVLRQLMVPTPAGVQVPLSTLAAVEVGGGIGDIVRIDNRRVVTVTAGVDEERAPAAVVRARAEKMLAAFPLPPGYTIRFTGENIEQQESEQFLSKAFVVACFLIFLILVSQFNSISQPFLIMTSVVLSLGGAFLGLAIYRQPFGIIMTGVGVISLAGVVVNNAIVLIDYTNKLKERGMAVREAVVAAGATRLRPVLLTAITTILGLIPMVTGISFDFGRMTVSWASESSQWWKSMAIVVIFGLMVSTFLTLVVVPTLYSLFERLGGKWRGAAGQLQRVLRNPNPDDKVLKQEHTVMKRFFFLATASLFLWQAVPARAVAPLELTLAQAVEMALANNLGIKIIREDVAKAQGAVQGEEGAFDPVLVASGSHKDSRKTAVSSFEAGKEKTSAWSASLKQKIRSGAELDLSWENARYSSDLSFLTIDPAYSSGLSAGISQPLLQGRGQEMQTAGLRARQKNVAAAERAVDSSAVDLAALVKETYWQLVYAIQEIEVKKLSLELARTLLDDTQKKIDAGAMAGVEIFQPESEVARREEALIAGERTIADLQDRLQQLLNRPDWSTPLVPIDLPSVREEVPVAQTIVAQSLEKRPDIMAAARRIEAAEITVTLKENMLRPSLDLFGRMGLAGVDDAYGDSVGDIAADAGTIWKVGLAFSLPLGNNGAKGELAAARADLRKARLDLELLKQETTRVARQAVRDIGLSLKSIHAGKKTTLALQRRLQAEQDKFDVGLSTALDVLEAQEAYALAVAHEKRASVDHAIAQARLARALGSL